MKREDLKVSNTYVHKSNARYIIKILYIGKQECFVFDITDDDEYTVDTLRILENFEPYKEKKRYWIWSYKPKLGSWHQDTTYRDDEGFDTSGARFPGWYGLYAPEKIKHEDEFIDV